MKLKALISTALMTFINLPKGFGNTVDTYGLSARGMSLGSTMTSEESGAYNAYYNPAALTDNQSTVIAVGLNTSDLHLRDLSGGSQTDVSGLSSSTYAASDAKNISGTTLGVNLPLTNHLNFGLAGYLPADSFGRVTGIAPNEYNYLRYGDRQQRPAVYTALAYRFDRLSIGLGAYYSLKAAGTLEMSLNNQSSAARFDLRMLPVIIPFGGLQYKTALAGGMLKIAAYYRGEQDTESTLSTNLRVNVGESVTLPLNIESSLVPFYDPETIKIGSSYQINRLALHVELEQQNWSKYRSPLIQLSGASIVSLTDRLTVDETVLQDTQNYRLAASYQTSMIGGMEARAGLEVHQSASDDTSRGIVDLDRQVIGLGAGWNWTSKLQNQERLLSLDLAYQLTLLSDKSISTDNGPIEAGGSVDTFIAGFRYAI